MHIFKLNKKEITPENFIDNLKIKLFTKGSDHHENEDRIAYKMSNEIILISAIDGISFPGERCLNGGVSAQHIKNIIENMDLNKKDVEGKEDREIALIVFEHIKKELKKIEEDKYIHNTSAIFTAAIEFFDSILNKYRAIGLYNSDGALAFKVKQKLYDHVVFMNIFKHTCDNYFVRCGVESLNFNEVIKLDNINKTDKLVVNGYYSLKSDIPIDMIVFTDGVTSALIHKTRLWFLQRMYLKKIMKGNNKVLEEYLKKTDHDDVTYILVNFY